MVKKDQRLRKNVQFSAVYERGRTWFNNLIVIKVLPNGLSCSRYGFVTSKQLGNAVTRNRVRRLLREVVKLTLVKPGWDVVIIARKRAAVASHFSLGAAVSGLLGGAQILTDKDSGQANKES